MQKVVGPPGVIVGVAGIGFSFTITVFETAEVHPNATTRTVTDWAAGTVAVVPVPKVPLQTLLAGALEVNSTEPPVQNEAGPTGVMEGVVGTGFTVTTTGAETAEVHPPATA